MPKIKNKPNHQHNEKYFLDTKWTVDLVKKEINTGLKLLSKIDQPIVTILGSHRVQPGSRYYEHSRKLANELALRGYAIVTGGGPGIMQAANTGASEAGGTSIGIKASLLRGEKIADSIFTNQLSYHFLFVRRFILSIKSDALVFYPGAYGTLNELFEYIVLMQIAFIDKVPVVCVDKKFWKGLFAWLKNAPREEGFFINNKQDLALVQFADSVRQVIKLIEKH